MAIDVEIQDECGTTLARYDGPPIGLQLLKLAPAKSVCFRFIVPWGDATFNQEQIKSFGMSSKTRCLEPQTLIATTS